MLKSKNILFLIFAISPIFTLNANAIDFREDKCECPSIEISCSDDKMKSTCGGLAGACAYACQVFLSEQTCAERKLTAKTYSIKELNQHLSCNFEDKARQLAGGEVTEEIAARINSEIDTCLSLIHELVHVCIGNVAELNRQIAAEESGANQVELIGLQQALTAICSSTEDRQKGGRLRQLCGKLCVSAYSKDLYTQWTKCLADKGDADAVLFGDWLTPAECCDCLSQCKAKKLSTGAKYIPQFCWDDYYSTDTFKKEVEGKELDKVCETMAFSKDHYSCGKMSKFGAEQFGNACP